MQHEKGLSKVLKEAELVATRVQHVLDSYVWEEDVTNSHDG